MTLLIIRLFLQFFHWVLHGQSHQVNCKETQYEIRAYGSKI